MTTLARITIYPIKSLDGVDLEKCDVLPSGALRNDRRWALVDESGRFVNGKRTAAIHAIHAEFAPDLETVTLSHHAIQPVAFRLATENIELDEWLSEALQMRCKLIEDRETGFPDDLEAAGPTIVSTSTLKEVAGWFGLSPEETHRRFRANLAIDATEPFWEDRLVGQSGRPVSFTVGGMRWLGVNPCQRCVVPSRDSRSGEVYVRFQRQFVLQREAMLPTWTPRERFDHFYRLTVNTRLADRSTGSVRVGDELTVEI